MSTTVCQTLSAHPPLLDQPYGQPHWEPARPFHAPLPLNKPPPRQVSHEKAGTNVKTSTSSTTDQSSLASTTQPPPHTPFPRTSSTGVEQEQSSRNVHSHVRAQSDASPMHAQGTPSLSWKQTHRRHRTSSTTTLPAVASLRLLSHPITAPAVLEKTVSEHTLGSFAPTSSSRDSLRSVLAGTTSRFASLWSSQARIEETADESSASGDDRQTGSASESSPCPPRSPSIPSICRTPSSYTGSEYFPSAPSSAGPATPALTASPSPKGKQKALHPVLDSLEQASKFRTQMCCATCKKTGANFPCCPRCGDKWCSRECRLQGSGGKKHVCAK